jgi:hypothetical protein
MRILAEHLIAQETRENNASGTESTVTFPASQKLRVSLAALVGNTGFDALLSRALVLASPEMPWLRLVRVKADGALVGPADLGMQVAPEKIAAGRVALLVHLLELLSAFIGETMTVQLMSELWPNLVLTKLRSGSGDENDRKD